MLKQLTLAGAAGALLLAAACSDGGSAEEAGQNLDSSIEEATQGHENAGDGPMERAGEAVDEATGNTNGTDAADAVSDATDGNPSTNP